jgi:hypothetical protein
MERKDKKTGNGLPVRSKTTGKSGASHIQRNGTGMTQVSRLSSSNESGRDTNTHESGANGRDPNPTNSVQTRHSATTHASTRAVASGTPRRGSQDDSIDLEPNPEHQHARDMDRTIQELQKKFDGDEDDDDSTIGLAK